MRRAEALNPNGFFNSPLAARDAEIEAAIGRELNRQQSQIELIASENIVSRAVLEAQGSVLTNKYAEGLPGKPEIDMKVRGARVTGNRPLQQGRGKGVIARLDRAGTVEPLEVDAVLVAVGMAPNTAGLGLEDAGVRLDARGFIAVDQHQQTSVPGIYAIGDVAGKQLLAHKASAEAEAAVGHLVGHPHPVAHGQIPGCTYCQPQVASVGLTEKKAQEGGRAVKIGRFRFQASGKATAIGHPEGFVKLIFDASTLQLLGAHLVGHDATELLAELGLALKLECTAAEIMGTVHAHPTLSEAVMEAAADALGACVHQ